jgi:hypothetical protein
VCIDALRSHRALENRRRLEAGRPGTTVGWCSPPNTGYPSTRATSTACSRSGPWPRA